MAVAVAGGSRSAPKASTILRRRAAARFIDFSIGVAIFFGMATVLASTNDGPDGTGPMIVAITSTFIAYWIYEVTGVALFGRTVGKQLLALRVERNADGGRPGIWRAALRNMVPTVTLVAFFPLYPLAWMCELLGDHRWPNDRLAGTRVVRRVRRSDE